MAASAGIATSAGMATSAGRKYSAVLARVLQSLCVLVAGTLACAVASAQDRYIEDIRVSRIGSTATVEVRLACAMRFQADIATELGALIEVRIAPFDNCRALGIGGRSEIRRPLNGRLAGLIEVEYEPLGPGDSVLLLRFEKGVSYTVEQSGDLRALLINVDLAAPPGSDTVSALPIVPGPTAADPSAPNLRSTSSERAPLTPRTVAPTGDADFMVNLQSTREPVDPRVLGSIVASADQQLYISRTSIDGRTWYRLRLGFFASEAEARQVLETLRPQFPRAWIGRAEPAEIITASTADASAGISESLLVVAAESFEAQTPNLEELRELPPEEITAKLEQARQAMLDGDFVQAIAFYSELQNAAGDHRPDAAEFLGVAYQRSGSLGQARAQYEWYLLQFPSAAGSSRVRQRLNGIVLANETPRQSLRAASAESVWETAFGVSQYYRRDDNQFDQDQATVTTLSALISDIDWSLQRRGERFDMSSRISVSNFHDMLDNPRTTDQNRISYAYFDLESTDAQWWLRLGRQSLHNWGVLGRFDGARFDYNLSSDRIVHVMMGYPVETTRNSLETDRKFYGASVEFQDVVGAWDVVAFVNSQSIEGVAARNAIGTEIRYSDQQRTFTTIVDYDVDFGEINTVLMLGTWRLPNRITISALIDERKSPVLTTRNALIGQPVATVEELLLVWSEDEIRQLAVDRTAESSTITVGLAAPLGQRLQLNFDYTRSEISGTVASAGVSAIEETGAQSFFSTSLVSTGLFASSDVSIFNLRYGTSKQFKTTTFTWDARFPIGRRIRLNPRLRWNSWEGLLDGRIRESISPTIRLLFNTRRHYRLELEVGSNSQTRTDLSGEREAIGRFVNFGYRANF